MESLFLAALNGLSYGMLLFMLSAGLTVIFSMMGVLNFAHASFYMVGAYLASTLANIWGFAWALVLAPLCVGLLGMAFERYGLRRVSRQGHVAELLLTFGLSFLLLEMVQLVWGRGSVSYLIPETLQGSLFTFSPSNFYLFVQKLQPPVYCSLSKRSRQAFANRKNDVCRAVCKYFRQNGRRCNNTVSSQVLETRYLVFSSFQVASGSFQIASKSTTSPGLVLLHNMC